MVYRGLISSAFSHILWTQYRYFGFNKLPQVFNWLRTDYVLGKGCAE